MKETIKITVFDEDGCEFEHEVPAKYELCYTCEGRGQIVNPNIDGNGISPQDFIDDPDFAEDYFGGVYDIPCSACDGLRVIKVVNEKALSKEDEQIYKEYLKQQEDNERFDREWKQEIEMQLRMGGYY